MFTHLLHNSSSFVFLKERTLKFSDSRSKYLGIIILAVKLSLNMGFLLSNMYFFYNSSACFLHSLHLSGPRSPCPQTHLLAFIRSFFLFYVFVYVPS